MIIIDNDGARIRHSSYWQSELAAAGIVYCTANAGVIRVLLPPALTRFLPDIAAAQEVVLSRGPWPEKGLAEAVELMWDDRSEAPFALWLEPGSFAPMPAEPGQGEQWRCTVWIEGPTQVCEHICHYRRAAQLRLPAALGPGELRAGACAGRRAGSRGKPWGRCHRLRA